MDVRDLQAALAALGLYAGALDGKFGPLTRSGFLTALTAPRNLGLSAGAPWPQRLTDYDLAQAAEMLDCSVAHVRAVVKVESNGRGFHPVSGRPVILFEPHVFDRLTDDRFDKVAPDLSYDRWGQRPYPDSQAERWDQLVRAAALDPDAAISAASWGLFQILGSNWRSCGAGSPWLFARAMASGEGAQLLLFCRFVQDQGLDEPLREGRWATFARGYNGPAYAKHAYDQRLKAAYEASRRK